MSGASSSACTAKITGLPPSSTTRSWVPMAWSVASGSDYRAVAGRVCCSRNKPKHSTLTPARLQLLLAAFPPGIQVVDLALFSQPSDARAASPRSRANPSPFAPRVNLHRRTDLCHRQSAAGPPNGSNGLLQAAGCSGRPSSGCWELI